MRTTRTFLFTLWLTYALACGGGAGDFLVTQVELGPIEATVNATGTVNPVHMVEVGTYASGRVESVAVDYNSRVKKGELIAKIDPSNARVRVKKARANVLSARAKVRGAAADLRLKTEQLERQRVLHDRTTVSQDHYEAAETAHAQAESRLDIDRAQLAEREAELENSEVNLAHTDIFSPVDGIVLSKNVNVGQTVAASFRTPTLFLIAEDLRHMQVDSDVSEADIGQIKNGQIARFAVDAFPSRQFEGRVRQIRNSPRSVQNVVTYDVVIDVDNDDLALRPGMTATVTLITASRERVLKVPRRALRFRPKFSEAKSAGHLPGRLFIENSDGEPEPVDIELGLRDDEFVEILAGSLKEGDIVITGYRREL